MGLMRKKITVVGAGQVGTTVAQLVAYKNLGNVVMVVRLSTSVRQYCYGY